MDKGSDIPQRGKTREEILAKKQRESQLTRVQNLENALAEWTKARNHLIQAQARGIPDDDVRALQADHDRAKYTLGEAVMALREGDSGATQSQLDAQRKYLEDMSGGIFKPEVPLIGEAAPWPAIRNSLGAIFESPTTAYLQTKREHLNDANAADLGSQGLDYAKNLWSHFWSPHERAGAGEQMRRLIRASPESRYTEVKRVKELQGGILEGLPSWVVKYLTQAPRDSYTETSKTVKEMPVSLDTPWGKKDLGSISEDAGALGAEAATLASSPLGNVFGFPNRVVKGATGYGMGSHAMDAATRGALKLSPPGTMNPALRFIDYIRPGGALRRIHLENPDIDPLAVWDDAVKAQVRGSEAMQKVANDYANTMRGMSVEDRAMVIDVAEGSMPRALAPKNVQDAADVMIAWDKTIGEAHAKALGYTPYNPRSKVVMNPENLSDMSVPEGGLRYVRHAWSKAWEAEQKAKKLGLDPDFLVSEATPGRGPTPQFTGTVPQHRSWVDILNQKLSLAPGQSPTGKITMPAGASGRQTLIEEANRAAAAQQGIPTAPLQDTVRDVNDFTRSWFGEAAFSADPATQALYRIRQGRQIPFADLIRDWAQKYGEHRTYPVEPKLIDPSNVGTVVPGMRTPVSSPLGIKASNPGQHALWERLTEQGMSKDLAQGTEAIPNALADYIELHTRNNTPGKFLQGLSTLGQNWKASVTAINPTYHLRNKATNIGARWMTGGMDAFHPDVYAAVDAIKAGKPFTLKGKQFDGAAVREEFLNHGLISPEDTVNPTSLGDTIGLSPYEQVSRDALRVRRGPHKNTDPWQSRWGDTQSQSLVNPAEDSPLRKITENLLFPRKWETTRRMGDWGARNIEEQDRMLMALSEMAGGADIKSAMRTVDQNMFNRYRYPEWAQGETKAGQVSSMLVPFGGWQSSNANRYMSLAAEKPQAIWQTAVFPENVSAQATLADPKDREQFLSGRWRGQIASGGPALALGTSKTGKPVVASNAFSAMAEPIDMVSALTAPWSFATAGPTNFVAGPVMRRTTPLVSNIGLGYLFNWDPQRQQKIVENLQTPSGAVEASMNQVQQAGRMSSLAHEGLWKLNDATGGKLPFMPKEERNYTPVLQTQRSEGGDIMQKKSAARFADLFRNPLNPVGGFAESQAELDPLTFTVMSTLGMTPQVMDWDKMLRQYISSQSDYRSKLGSQESKLSNNPWQMVDQFNKR